MIILYNINIKWMFRVVIYKWQETSKSNIKCYVHHTPSFILYISSCIIIFVVVAYVPIITTPPPKKKKKKQKQKQIKKTTTTTTKTRREKRSKAYKFISRADVLSSLLRIKTYKRDLQKTFLGSWLNISFTLKRCHPKSCNFLFSS